MAVGGAAGGGVPAAVCSGHVWLGAAGRPAFLAPMPNGGEGHWQYLLRYFYTAVLAAGFFGAIKYFTDSVALRRNNQQLLIEKQTSELEFLKAQTNPHFLFNTLNNIYGLAREGSALTADAIMRLSKILRFMLYETGGAQIAIGREMAIINDYLELEKLRYSNRLQVSFTCQVANEQQHIPPLLLLPLVENAFKHGVSETRQQTFVHITLKEQNGQLDFLIENSVSAKAAEEPAKNNIGLANIKRQLQLLFGNYQFEAARHDNRFITRLCINLHSYEPHTLPGG